MKMISWNVNGLRACVQKGFLSYLYAESPDIIALQETKLQPEQVDFAIEGYYVFWNSAVKKGYSGTAVFTKTDPLSVIYGIGLPEHDAEGRAITLEYSDFYFVNVYTPNAQDGLKRLVFRGVWEDGLLDYLKALDEKKPVVYCGDLNVAHEEIDLRNPKTNRGNPGFSDEERGMMSRLLDNGFSDTFRRLYPDRTDAYSWWSFRAAARERNVGWRIDYFIVSERFLPRVRDSLILSDIQGSDHCPVCLLTED